MLELVSEMISWKIKKVPEQSSSYKGCDRVIFNHSDPEPGEPELKLQLQLMSPLLLVKT